MGLLLPTFHYEPTGSPEAAYRGDVYILDCTTNNQGSQAAASLTGMENVGMLGKELRSSENATWLSYAIPANELALGLSDLKWE